MGTGVTVMGGVTTGVADDLGASVGTGSTRKSTIGNEL
jgi:hypothetical protein